jgi:hypothetical protein
MNNDIVEMPDALSGELTIKIGVPQTHVRRSVATCLPVQFLLSEGLQTLVAKTRVLVGSHTSELDEPFEIYLKSAVQHNQSQYVRLDVDNFEPTLRAMWRNANRRRSNVANFRYPFFVYCNEELEGEPTTDTPPNIRSTTGRDTARPPNNRPTTGRFTARPPNNRPTIGRVTARRGPHRGAVNPSTRRATQGRITEALDSLREHISANPESTQHIGEISLQHLGTLRARLPDNSPMEIPDSNTLQQMYRLDAEQRQLNERDNSPRQDSLRPVDFFINGGRVTFIVDVNSLRRAIGLPEHDLLATGIFNAPITPVQVENPAQEDIDHADPSGPHALNEEVSNTQEDIAQALVTSTEEMQAFDPDGDHETQAPIEEV